MQLYFIAILPPADISVKINEIKQYLFKTYGFKHALKSPPHITLRPPFKMYSQQEEELCDSLSIFAKTCNPFIVELKDFGHFRKDVIYIKPVVNSSLNDLYMKLQMHLQEKDKFMALPPYPQFNPHITVAFRDLTRSIFDKLWPEFQDKKFEDYFMARDIVLLKHTMKKWDIHTVFPFVNA